MINQSFGYLKWRFGNEQSVSALDFENPNSWSKVLQQKEIWEENLATFTSDQDFYQNCNEWWNMGVPLGFPTKDIQFNRGTSNTPARKLIATIF